MRIVRRLRTFALGEKSPQVFDELAALEVTLNDGVRSNLIHLAGYIIRKVDSTDDASYFYYEKYGNNTKSLNRCVLKMPEDSTCQWVLFCFILFNSIQSRVCRKSLITVFQDVSNHYGFPARKCHCITFSSTLSYLLCKRITPLSAKETQQKVIKIS